MRISFVGGGSDLPAFYRKFGGAVISTAIDKFVYVNLNKKFDDGIRIAYSKTEEVSSVSEIQHQLFRACLEYVGIKGGIEIATLADIPSSGSGLGSSSSFAVGLVHALNAYQGRYVPSEQLAVDSCRIEIDICGDPIGKQDQYAAAFGGFNLIEFSQDDSVAVSPIICDRRTIATIESNILVLYTGVTRSSSALLKKQSAEIVASVATQQTLRRMVELTYILRTELQKNNIDAFGQILHENWILKKNITPDISSGPIDEWYEIARKAGAAGGKILGAGGGGFLMLYAPKETHSAIKSKLSMLRPIDVKFEALGSKIIFYH